jgi:hypothetical protein
MLKVKVFSEKKSTTNSYRNFYQAYIPKASSKNKLTINGSNKPTVTFNINIELLGAAMDLVLK